MRNHEDEFSQVGARLAAIGLGDAHYARSFRKETGITFPLFVDAERKAYRAAQLHSGSLLHILRRDNFAARKRAKAAGHKQHRLGKDPFQLGASLVLAPGNVDRYVHLSTTFGDNADPAALLAAVQHGHRGGERHAVRQGAQEPRQDREGVPALRDERQAR